MTRAMLDTNMVGKLLKEHPAVLRHVLAVPMATLLHRAVEEFLKRVDVLPQDSGTAARYGTLRAEMERQGKSLGALDLPIAAHALTVDAVLVTNDAAFAMVPGLTIEDCNWPVPDWSAATDHWQTLAGWA